MRTGGTSIRVGYDEDDMCLFSVVTLHMHVLDIIG